MRQVRPWVVLGALCAMIAAASASGQSSVRVPPGGIGPSAPVAPSGPLPGAGASQPTRFGPPTAAPPHLTGFGYRSELHPGMEIRLRGDRLANVVQPRVRLVLGGREHVLPVTIAGDEARARMPARAQLRISEARWQRWLAGSERDSRTVRILSGEVGLITQGQPEWVTNRLPIQVVACATCAWGWDEDGDGVDAMFAGGQDCDDRDRRRYPGEPEVCDANHVDEDCNPATGGVRDADGDGHSACMCHNGSPAPRCDCDDNRASSHHGSVDVCNGHDDDCDGRIDEELTGCRR
jgi:hypothetical protein